MDIERFKENSSAFRNKLVGLLMGSLFLGWFSYSMQDWAEDLYGWQSELIIFLFSILGGLSGLSILTFGVLLNGWYKNYKNALSDAPNYDEESLGNKWKSVLGPIPWI